MSKPFRAKTETELRKALETLVEEAYALGSSQARAIPVDRVVVDERVRYKCRWGCDGYNTNLMCPPYTITPDEARRLLESYKHGILVRVEGTPEDFVSGEEEATLRRNQIARKLREIVIHLEAKAFYHGFYLPLSLVAGRCRLCSEDEPVCRGLASQRCVNPTMARPSMEALSIDVLATMLNVGWDAYVVGRETKPSDVPRVGYCGLLLVY